MNRIDPRAGALFALAFALAACSGTPSAGATATGSSAAGTALDALPHGTRWQLADSDQAGLEPLAEALVTLHIDAGRLYGNSGCNQYSAGYRFIDGHLRLEPVAATKRACLGPGMAVEAAWFGALRQLREFRRDGELLLLVLADGGRVRFRPLVLETE